MLSIPPATMTSADFATSASCARIIASIAEPHILLTVVQPVASGNPALIDAWRAGACPWPAGSTQPKIVLSTSAGWMPARCTAALIATAPRSLADSDAKSPWKPPIGVRAAPTMTIGSLVVAMPSYAGNSRIPRDASRPRDELAAAIRAAPIHRVGASGAERAFVAADPRVAGCHRKLRCALLTH